MKSDDVLLYGAFALVAYLAYRVVSGNPANASQSSTSNASGSSSGSSYAIPSEFGVDPNSPW